MKTIPVLLLILVTAFAATAQDSARARAKNFINQGDFANAVLVLNQALAADEKNIELQKDLAFAYYLSRDYTRALAAAKPITERNDADVQSYQILGMVYKAIEQRKEAERMYRIALRKFPESGALYSEYGEVIWTRQGYIEAAKQWQKGIQADPNYPGNYYNASKYYFMTADKVWGILYGEIFLNLESFSKRTPEIKTMLLEGYKKLFSETDMSKNQDTRNDFVKAFLEVMKAQSSIVAGGITPDALSALRARFILQWHEKYAAKFPYRLFDHHRQLASEGIFDAYNQWIFGAANDLAAFQRWCANNAEAYSKFTNFQKNRVFKLPQGQFYQNRR